MRKYLQTISIDFGIYVSDEEAKMISSKYQNLAGQTNVKQKTDEKT